MNGAAPETARIARADRAARRQAKRLCLAAAEAGRREGERAARERLAAWLGTLERLCAAVPGTGRESAK